MVVANTTVRLMIGKGKMMMTTSWGPAFDAEIDYRQQRARADFRSRLWHRKLHTTTTRRPAAPHKAG